jgi:hypothetical protein
MVEDALTFRRFIEPKGLHHQVSYLTLVPSKEFHELSPSTPGPGPQSACSGATAPASSQVDRPAEWLSSEVWRLS